MSLTIKVSAQLNTLEHGHAKRWHTGRLAFLRKTAKALPLLLGCLFALASQSTVAAPPSFSKSFSPGTIGPGSVSTLTFTITETDAVPTDNLAFTDMLPAGVTLATPALAGNSCSGILSAPDGGSIISLSGGRLAALGSCTIRVDVTSSTAGMAGMPHTNTTGDLTSDAGNSGTTSADLIVDSARPGFTKQFAPASIAVGQTSTLTFTVDNMDISSSAVESFTFTDTLPTGLLIASPANATSDCGTPPVIPTITAVSGTGFISVSTFGNVSFPAIGAVATCTVSVDVITSTAGPRHNSSGELFSGPSINPNNISSGKANATLAVTNNFLTKVFTNDPVGPGGTVNLKFTLNNTDRNNAATAISFTDDLDATLSGLAVTGLPLADVCGAGSVLSGTSSLDFTGGSLASAANCSFSVTLAVPGTAATGSYLNTTSTVSVDIGGGTTTEKKATDTLVVKPVPLFTKEFTNDPVNAGDDVTLSFSITNSDTGGATDIAFTDELTTFLPFPITTVPDLTISPAADVCGTGSSLGLVPLGIDGQGLSLTGGTLAANGSLGDTCTFDVMITVPDLLPPGSYTNTTSNITATIGGNTVEGGAATDDLVVRAGPALSKTFTDDPVVPGGTATLEFTLNHGGNAVTAATAISFTAGRIRSRWQVGGEARQVRIQVVDK